MLNLTNVQQCLNVRGVLLNKSVDIDITDFKNDAYLFSCFA